MFGNFIFCLDILLGSIVVISSRAYSSVQFSAPLRTDYISLENKSTVGHNYVWKDRPFGDPRRQNKLSRWYRPSLWRTSSPKMSKSQDQLLHKVRRNGNASRVKLPVRDRLGYGNDIHAYRSKDGIEESRMRRFERSGRRSRFNDESHLRSVPIGRGFFWEPIFDGRVIAAIGSLFTKSVKDESNRERLERKKTRETRLVQMYTKILNDPAQFNLLKKQSAGLPHYVNQIVR